MKEHIQFYVICGHLVSLVYVRIHEGPHLKMMMIAIALTQCATDSVDSVQYDFYSDGCLVEGNTFTMQFTHLI